jgi:hypothetical protein
MVTEEHFGKLVSDSTPLKALAATHKPSARVFSQLAAHGL